MRAPGGTGPPNPRHENASPRHTRSLWFPLSTSCIRKMAVSTSTYPCIRHLSPLTPLSIIFFNSAGPSNGYVTIHSRGDIIRDCSDRSDFVQKSPRLFRGTRSINPRKLRASSDSRHEPGEFAGCRATCASRIADRYLAERGRVVAGSWSVPSIFEITQQVAPIPLDLAWSVTMPGIRRPDPLKRRLSSRAGG